MEQGSTTTEAGGTGLFAGGAWFDPIEAGIRERVREFVEPGGSPDIQELLEQELTASLGRGKSERASGEPKGCRNGTRKRQLLGSFGPVEVEVPRARMAEADGGAKEWRSAALRRYARMTRQVEALIAGAYLSGTNTRRVKRALAALFGGAVGKDAAQIAARFRWVGRTWRKIKVDWEAWGKRDLADEDVVRLILDGTVVRVRLDRKATSISLLVALGVRRDGQKVLLSVKSMGGESEAAWRSILDDLVARGLRTPDFLITDGAAGLERALAALWPEVPAQRCTVHTIRTQSRGFRRCWAVAAREWGTQWDDMADFQATVADDDALDHQLQDGLLFRQSCLSQAAADALAKCRHVGPHRLSLELLLA